MNKKYQVIIADPPWAPGDHLTMSSVKRGAAANYPVMSTDQICALPVKQVADPNGCILALWVLGSMLEDGMRVMKAWGFEQKQVYVWVKTKKEPLAEIVDITMRLVKAGADIPTKKRRKKAVLAVLREVKNITMLAFGMGHLFRQTHEICLIGINNTKIYSKLENRSQRSVSFANNEGHSIKPDNLQDSLDIMFPVANKLEMFARRLRKDWDVMGYDVSDGEDILDSLRAIIGMDSEQKGSFTELNI